jgi:hypothetical protein
LLNSNLCLHNNSKDRKLLWFLGKAFTYSIFLNR